MRVLRSAVTGVGGYLPPRIMTNHDMAKIVDTSDEWIVERTGIRQRHVIEDGGKTSDLAVEAARVALAAAGKTPADVDMIVVATTTPDMPFPSTASIVQQKLGIAPCPAFDVQAVCSGFVYALSVADGFVARGMSRCVLVIGAEAMSRLLDYTDRGTCILFGDGAGAVVLEPVEGEGDNADTGILGFDLRCDGTKTDLLYVDGGVFESENRIGKIRMQGNQVFKHAVHKIAQAIEAAVEKSNLTIDDIDWFIPHQANQRILNGVAERLGLDEHKVISTVALHANTSAASIPLAWYEGVKDGRIKPGDVVLIEALGGGLTWGAAAIRL
ncbi:MULTISPECIES: beta-ketoacyl-ACP synthase III [Asticcacaulis]|uniref:beta-ketoacyl-ACP synthase III n=1 Tax=Asticcacaulis TaxID=76890 RepID=UPI001AE52724|nr:MULTISPECIES: beta-ketoacyl-ACP synthase III [Asticcacaulis]MBP2158369.1 3-oxoacyl-[acyl-carrier-protein] synthase-3 [Asticcacaulis solisilvae]MDR6799414.1 3-oxoacyl-[acyl-carrier-protein] synthase-3 [Asticcacaulis sp. BE141]